MYRGLVQKRVEGEEEEEEEAHVEAPLEGEGVEVYEEYAGSRVGTLRRMQGTGPLPEDQPGMPAWRRFLWILLVYIEGRHRLQFFGMKGC